MKNNYFYKLLLIILLSFILRYGFYNIIHNENIAVSSFSIVLVLAIGTFVVSMIAEIIEETTGILRHRTGLAGGLIQAVGTALPDMIVGITAAIMSIQALKVDYSLAINYAIIAASSTFGSNIWNIGFAAYCISRQNLANLRHKPTKFYPIFNSILINPMDDHKNRPKLIEVNTSIRIVTSLSVLTAVVAVLMVLFGRSTTPVGFSGELYGLKPIIGVVVFLSALFILYIFRKNHGGKEVAQNNAFGKLPTFLIWLTLLVCAASIFFTAETMVEAIGHACQLLNIPVVLGGTLAGIIGCLAEMIVVYKFTINPNGRIGDAVVGVAMDNIITVIGASLVAIFGGIFLGGSSLIIIFVLILTVNIVLIWQISELKDFFTDTNHFKD
jgi:hypothetical protein